MNSKKKLSKMSSLMCNVIPFHYDDDDDDDDDWCFTAMFVHMVG